MGEWLDFVRGVRDMMRYILMLSPCWLLLLLQLHWCLTKFCVLVDLSVAYTSDCLWYYNVPWLSWHELKWLPEWSQPPRKSRGDQACYRGLLCACCLSGYRGIRRRVCVGCTIHDRVGNRLGNFQRVLSETKTFVIFFCFIPRFFDVYETFWSKFLYNLVRPLY
jgi:hypothetical protein